MSQQIKRKNVLKSISHELHKNLVVKNKNSQDHEDL